MTDKNDLKGLSVKLDVVATQFVKNGAQLIRQLALEADRNLVLSTPVRTGLARSNWLPSINAERRDEIEDVKSENAAIQEAQQKFVNSKITDTLYLTNNVDYVKYLNEGSSDQAPAGFVESSIQAAVETAKNVGLLKNGN